MTTAPHNLIETSEPRRRHFPRCTFSTIIDGRPNGTTWTPEQTEHMGFRLLDAARIGDLTAGDWFNIGPDGAEQWRVVTEVESGFAEAFLVHPRGTSHRFVKAIKFKMPV